MPRGAGEEQHEALEVIDPPPLGRSCAKAGALCWYSGSRTTIAVESVVASAPQAAGKPPLQVTPRFARAASIAKNGAAPIDTTGSWTVDLQSTLKRPSWAGNMVFLIYDADDPDALAARQFTALYQTNVKAGKTLSAKLSLAPDEGFRSGHTYRVRIVQLVGGKEILMAEGDVTLL
jgi:hypothetical protein